MGTRTTAWALAAVLLAAAASAEDEAKKPSDLGPEIDVSSYPKGIQEDYAVFRAVCAQCHGLGRTLYSTIVTEEDWRRYIRRMRTQSAARPPAKISVEDAKRVLRFLVYDAKERKVKKKAAFDAQLEELKKKFERSKARKGA